MQNLVMRGNAMRQLRRFRQVVNVLAKYGFGEVLTRFRVWQHVNVEGRIFHHHHELFTRSSPERLRMALEELGPTFIKMGQMLSTRPDLVPPELILELKKLQASVHFLPTEIVKNTIETELGKPAEEIFDSFDGTPLAAASLAQVHRAVYKGKQVVVKVQRPDIEAMTETDIVILRQIAGMAERYSPKVYLINPLGIVDEFATQIKKELDFRMEAQNIRRFARNFANDKTIHVPDVYPEVCTKHIVTMEFMDGIDISNTERLAREGYDSELIARRGAVIGFKATFQHGFFHADPHPGNVFVLPGNIIGLVDFGMMATLSLRDRERLAKLVYFISIADEKRVARSLNELMEAEEVIPAEDLEPSMSSIIKEYGEVVAGELRLAGMLFEMMRAIVAHGGRLRPQLLWVTKSIAIQEEIAGTLSSNLNVMELARPYAQSLLIQKLNPLRQPFELYYWLMDTLDTARDLPYDLGIVLKEFRKGRLKIEFQHVGLEPLRVTADRIANRLSLTIIIAALLVSSSVIVLAKVPPYVGNIPVLGFLGYMSSLVLGIILVIAIIRR
jgi:ubiquinone biosynthesis protein